MASKVTLKRWASRKIAAEEAHTRCVTSFKSNLLRAHTIGEYSPSEFSYWYRFAELDRNNAAFYMDEYVKCHIKLTEAHI